MGTQRRHTIQQRRGRKLYVLLKVEVPVTGSDTPKVDTIAMCRPTLTRVIYGQIVGRGLSGPEEGGTESFTSIDYTSNPLHFDALRIWEAFWADWKSVALPTRRKFRPTGPGWTVRARAPEEA